MSTSYVWPMQFLLLFAEHSCCRAMISLRRRTFSLSSMSSFIWRLANVPGRSEYLNMNAASYEQWRISESVCWWSSSVSPQNPAMMSVDIPQSGTMLRIASMRSRYHSRVYLRFMALSITLLPLCTGRWMLLHTLGSSAITWSVSSLMSLGCEVVKRMRVWGAWRATVRNSCGNVTVSPSAPSKQYEFTFCPRSMISLNPFDTRSSTSFRMLCTSRLLSRPLV